MAPDKTAQLEIDIHDGATQNGATQKSPAQKSPAQTSLPDPDSYDADAIKTLEGLEAVRMRPGMYIGGTGQDGFSHLLWELIDNSVDEAAAGFAKRIEVIFHKDGSMSVHDNGRGIPVDSHASRGVSAVEVVFTELHAGGKFGGGAYGASGGLHGVGASVVNALSERVEVEIDRNGYTWRLNFHDRVAGKKVNGKFKASHELVKVKKISSAKTGTRVRFWPEREIFDPEVEMPFEAACERLKLASYLVPRLKVRAEDKRTGEIFEHDSKKGLVDYITVLSVESSAEQPPQQVTAVLSFSGTQTFHEKVSTKASAEVSSESNSLPEVSLGSKTSLIERECKVDVALRWMDNFSSQVVSFVNTIPTPDGGTHLAGFERALLYVLNDQLLSGSSKLAKLAKSGQSRVAKEDIMEGLVAVVSVSFPEPQFQGQTKRRLGTPAIQKIVYEIVKEGLQHWVATDGPRTHINALRDKLANAALGRMSARQALENKRKASKLSSAGMPDKLADCQEHGEDSELIIVEGESAAGPAKLGRNSQNMAILPLRGKVVNAAKSTEKQVFANAEANALFTAVGAGVKDEFNLEAARYGRIVILCDADVDGSHIRCLLLTLIYKYMRPMLEQGRVYAAQPPLFTTRVGDTIHRAFSESERDELTQKLAKGRRSEENIRWQRFKGLGEMNVDELAECALNPETRILRQITIEDAATASVVASAVAGATAGAATGVTASVATSSISTSSISTVATTPEALSAEQMFEVLMGEDVEARKNFLISNSSLIEQSALDI